MYKVLLPLSTPHKLLIAAAATDSDRYNPGKRVSGRHQPVDEDKRISETNVADANPPPRKITQYEHEIL